MKNNRAIRYFMQYIGVALLFILPIVPSWQAIAADTADSDAPSLEKLLGDIQERVNSTGTVECTFEQERNLSVFAHPILFTGKMVLSRPDKLRWENMSPIPSVLIFAGDKGIRCNDDAPPVHFDLEKDQVMNMVAEQIWTWADGRYDRMRDKYDITLQNDREIKLVPRDSGFAEVIASVTVTFDRQSLQPETIRIMEGQGDSTTIRFTGYRINLPVDERLFTTCYP